MWSPLRPAPHSQAPNPPSHPLTPTCILLRKECSGQALLASTAGTPDAVHVIVNVRGQVKVDDVGDVGDVEPAGSHVGGNQHGGAPGAEGAQGLQQRGR